MIVKFPVVDEVGAPELYEVTLAYSLSPRIIRAIVRLLLRLRHGG